MSTAHEDAALRSWLSTVRAYHLCSEVLSNKLAELGFKTSEHEILVNLQRQPGLNQQALAERCFTTKSHISGLINEMASKGWILRQDDPEDGRAKRLILTTEGSEMAKRTEAVQAGVLSLMTEDVAMTELLLITQTMTEVCERLKTVLDARMK